MSSSPAPETSFEQALERLEEIVSAMEGDRMPLDEMVSSYEEGMRLLRVCRQRIETARKRIEMITAEADGKLTVAAFDPAAASAAEVQEEKARPAPAPARKKKPAEAEDDSDDIRLF
ncbi:MAG TPA: exodeoxyribonuclease VII small subunit [Prosthecobacter sp.]